MGKKFVLPGDYAGSSVEYLPGTGLYAEEDDLRSSNTGSLELDLKNHSAQVDVKPKLVKMQGLGTIALGVVMDVSESKAMVDLLPCESEKVREIPQGITAILRVSNVKREYVKDLHAEFKIGDVIKARIIDVSKHTVTLSTDREDLGVVKTSCVKCKSPVIRNDKGIKCTECGFSDSRKFSADYIN